MQINYFKEFLHSKDHMILSGVTLGIAIISGNILTAIIGIVAYGLGVMFMHDASYFKKKVDAKFAAEQQMIDEEKMKAFKDRQNRCYTSLSSSRKDQYNELVSVCKDIEKATTGAAHEIEGNDLRLRKLDELMWTYLKLLCIDQSIEVFLEYERKEDVPNEVKESEARLKQVANEIETLKASTEASSVTVLDSKQRLFSSLSDKTEVLRKRLQRIETAKINVEVVDAEQERLIQQIKLLRADAMASKNAEALTSKIDASVSHLEDTNKWLDQMTEFQDFSDDIPTATKRIGFEQDASVGNGYNPTDVVLERKVRIRRPEAYQNKTA